MVKIGGKSMEEYACANHSFAIQLGCIFVVDKNLMLKWNSVIGDVSGHRHPEPI